MTTDELTTTDPEAADHERAVRRLKKRRDFQGHVLVYVLFNTALVLVWVLTGSNGFFWPIFPIAFWGIGVVMNGWDVYRSESFSEERIQREIAKMRS